MQPVSSLCGVVAGLLCVLRCCASGQKSEPGMQFTRHPQPMTAPLGDKVFFECSLNPPAEKFAWRHRALGSNKWLPSHPISNSSGTSSRYIVTFDDSSKAGDYQCIAYFGTSGLASDAAQLTEAKIDKFIDKEDIFVDVPVGNTVPITCPVPYSAPEPIIRFIRNGNLIENANLIDAKTLVIENAKSTDSGHYHCTATNPITSITVTRNFKTVLSVHENPSDQSPSFVKQPRSKYQVLRGKNVTLKCFAVAYPVPKVTWTKLGNKLPEKSINKWSSLQIIDAQLHDRGEYSCVWKSLTNFLRWAITLTVVEPPSVHNLRFVNDRAQKSSTFSEGGDLELSCNATGYPVPDIEWLINGESLMMSKNVEIKGPNLFISPVEKKHAGIVQCVASNEYGSHSGYSILKVSPKQHAGGTVMSRSEYGSSNSGHKHTKVGRRRGKDGKRKGSTPPKLVPPNKPNVTRLSDYSVMVRWSVPENPGLPIQFFKVQYRELRQRLNSKQAKWNTAMAEIANHVRSFEVTELQPDHNYRFRVAAVYSNLDNTVSPISSRFHLNRDGGFESNKMPIPLLTKTEALSPDEVLLIWENPDPSTDIDGFYVYHRASTSAGEYVKTTVEGKTATNITISHLQPDSMYEFKVQSFSVDAASEFSQILKKKTKKAVTEPPVQQVLADNSLKTTETTGHSNIYAIIGGALGGVVLLGGLAIFAVTYKRSKRKQSRESSEEHGKPITNGRMMNGGIMDSKINITSNPLAGIDTGEDSIPKGGSPVEMATFLNGQNNNSNGLRGNSDPHGVATPLNELSSVPNEQPL